VPPIRILHVLGQMNRGGVETWLMQVLRNVDPARVRMDFLVTVAEPGHYDAEIVALGGQVLACGSPRRPLLFARTLARVLRTRGPYDVVHCHLHHFSGLVLAVAHWEGVPVRIAHSHSDTQEREAGAGLRRRVYLRWMETAVRCHATHGLAVSDPAAAALFGSRWRADARWQIARCGLDFAAFRERAPAPEIRADLGIPPRAIVLGHVGRFDSCKNQHMLVHVLAAAVKREPSAFLVLVGVGPLKAMVEEEAVRLGVRGNVLFAGLRADVPRVLRSFDVFVFPSLREGLPLVGLEAQAAGLPIVISDRVTREIAVVPELFTWKSPEERPEAWAEAALLAARDHREARDFVDTLERSEFALSRSLSGLLRVYGVAA